MAKMGFMGFFDKPEHRLVAAEMAVRNTEFGGKNNLIKVELNPSTNKVEFVLNATGQRFDSVERAFSEASGYMFTQFAQVDAMPAGIKALGKRAVRGEAINPLQHAAVGQILTGIQNNIRNIFVTSSDPATNAKRAEAFRVLQAMGFTEDQLKNENLSLNLATTKNQKGLKLSDTMERLRSKGQEFIPIIDKDGATLMQFRLGGKSLTEAQAFMLMSAVGNPLLSTDELYKKLLSKDGNLSSLMSKLGKRVRALVGERDLTLTLDDMSGSYTDKAGKVINVKAEKEVVIEEGLSFLKRRFGIGDNIDPDAAAFVSKVGDDKIKKIIESSFERSGMSEIETSSLLTKSSVRNIIRKSSTEDELKEGIEALLASGEITEKELRAFKQYMSDAAQEIDGLAILSEDHFNMGKKNIKRKIDQLKKEIASGSFGPAQKQQAYANLVQLQDLYQRVASAENLYQVTGRGYTPEGSTKVAFMVGKIDEDLARKGVYSVIGRSGKKRELGFVNARKRYRLCSVKWIWYSRF